jgi:hypothetical protein
LLGPPRLPYPPLDAILAIDFVLANFRGSVWRDLRSVAEYRRLVLEAQHRLWRPYMEMLGGAFVGEGPTPNDPVFDIWPNLLSSRTGHDKLIVGIAS